MAPTRRLLASALAVCCLACAGLEAPQEPDPVPAPETHPKRDKKRPKPSPVPGLEVPVDRKCEVSAFLMHSDGTVPVHVKADRTAAEVGQIPADHLYTRIGVRGRKGNFVAVNKIEIVIPKDGADKGTLPLKGWVDARKMRVNLESCYNGEEEVVPRLYAEPDASSAVVKRYDDSGIPAKVLGCAGSWWRVADLQGNEGWVVKGQWCNHAQTNCIQQCPGLAP